VKYQLSHTKLRHLPLLSRINIEALIHLIDIRLEVFTAVTMKNGVFWDVMTCGSCKNRRFGVTWSLLHQVDKNR
jgi:hypothetical protein